MNEENKPAYLLKDGHEVNKVSFVGILLDKIKEDKLSPKPRWQFLLKNYLVYIAGSLALVIGAIAVSVMVYLIKFNDWNFYYHTKKSFWEFFFLTAPYFWLLFLVLFIFIVYYNLKHTRKGYRYPAWLLVIASIVFSIILGAIFFSIGLGQKIDDVLGRRAPFYSHVFNPQIDFWSHPEEGRLAGIIIGRSEDQSLILLDRDLKEWKISSGSLEVINSDLSSRQPIRLIGRQSSDNDFVVDQVLFPGPPGRGFFRDLEQRPRMRRMKMINPENSLPNEAPDSFPRPRY